MKNNKCKTIRIEEQEVCYEDVLYELMLYLGTLETLANYGMLAIGNSDIELENNILMLQHMAKGLKDIHFKLSKFA